MFRKLIYIILIFPLFNFAEVSNPKAGDIIDRFNNIEVYYNGDLKNVFGRNTTYDGYNLGLMYQCVEYVKRYYYYIYDHKMPDSYGHAKDFFDTSLLDTEYNKKRDLYQFKNGSQFKPEVGDILVFGPTNKNRYGHVGIVTWSEEGKCEIIQQNVGSRTRERFQVYTRSGKYYVAGNDVLGWLRKD